MKSGVIYLEWPGINAMYTMKYSRRERFWFIHKDFVHIRRCKIHFEKNINSFSYVIFLYMRYNSPDDKWVLLF